MRNLPVNTYRIQFNKNFTFRDLRTIIPYLKDLGVDCIYASPIFKAVPGSDHGYDITNPHEINPEIGTYNELRNLKELLQQNEIKWIQDIVPNHMAFHSENFWLMDVLEKKRESEYFNFFDVNWHHPYSKGKLMIPVLGEPLSEAISKGKIKLKLKDEGIHIEYFEQSFPSAITSYKYILDAASVYKKKVLSIINRDEEIQDNLDQFTENKKMLTEFLDLQNFQLVHWQEANHTINYRRFFTINSLICLKMEEENVFNYYHKFIFRLIKEEIFDGLRIDHIDGLLDPTTYLKRLNKSVTREIPIFVEKILEPSELLPAEWKCEGTTGYDFLANINRLLTNTATEHKLKEAYFNLTGKKINNYEKIVFENKLHFLKNYMGGELNNLFMLLKEVLPNADKEALAAMLAGMPVYRLYPGEKGLKKDDKLILHEAAERARRYMGTDKTEEIYQFMSDGSNEQWLYFMQKFQQLSGPLAAKGIEDTTFYQYNLLISHNEVGDSPDFEKYSSASFSRYILDRNENTQYTINATSTHDTKRGEDARARINVLSEVPEKWKLLLNSVHTDNNIDKNDQYFLLQSILGSYSKNAFEKENYKSRLSEYMIKAVREGKLNSNWDKPEEAYEQKIKETINEFFNQRLSKEFETLISDCTFYGALNSLSQLVLKYTVPGIADTYQGSELWNFSFVDPDNRLPVDYNLRNKILNKIKGSATEEQKNYFSEDPNNSEIKLFFTDILMNTRLMYKDLFLHGDFEPLEFAGELKDNIYGFSRKINNSVMLVLCGRLFASVYPGNKLNAAAWSNTQVKLKYPGSYRNVFSNSSLVINSEKNINELFDSFPVAVLIKK